MPTPDYDMLAARLRELREEAGLSQAQLAQRCGISNKTVSGYERGNARPPALATLAKIATALEADPAELARLADLPFDSTVVEQARRALQTRPSTQLAAMAGRLSYQTLAEMASVARPTLRVSGQAVPLFEEFDREHLQLLTALIDHRWDCSFEYFDNVGEQTNQLLADTRRSHVAVGVVDTLSRRALGLDFIPYDGLRWRVNGVVRADLPRAPTWAHLQSRTLDIRAVAILNEVGYNYLRAVCGYREDDGNLLVIDDLLDDRFASFSFDLLGRNPNQPTVICASEFRCAQLLARPDTPMDLRMLWTETDSSHRDGLEPPTFFPGFAVLAGDKEFGDLLRMAIAEAFLNAPAQLAEIYARLFSRLIPLDNPANHGLNYARMYPSPNMSPAFMREFRERVESHLSERSFALGDHGPILAHLIAPSEPLPVRAHPR